MHSIVTVIPQTAETVYDLTTVEAVNAALGLTSSTANDAEVAAQITAGSKTIADLCGRVFAAETVTETFRIGWHEPGAGLRLSRYPVIGEVSITSNDTAVSADEYDVEIEAGIIWKISGLWHGRKIVVSYSGGYSLPSGAPAPLARACFEFVRDQRNSAARDPGIRDVWAGENRVSYFGQQSSNSGGALSPSIEGLIAPFRRLAV